MSSLIATAILATYLVGTADAFWRLPCKGIAGLGRLDPIVQPGGPSDHTHAIFGSSGFGFNSGADELLASNCTSCQVTQDRSAYWTPALYFVDDSGKTELVPNVGGMLAYYDLFGDPNTIEAFPNGFKMVAGDTKLRSSSLPKIDPPTSKWTAEDMSQPVLAQRALGFNCLHYEINPEPSRFRHFMPDKAFLDANCTTGLRLELMFPSCWNGKDLDTPNHKSHVAYPSLVDGGTCPKGFEKRVPTLFYETIWATHTFKERQGQFALANGDPTGYGYHGDFLAAWEDGVLSQAVKTCTNPSGRVEDCDVFKGKLQSEDEQLSCQFNMPPVLKADNCHGPREGLPGNVLIQGGSGYAAKGSGSSDVMSSAASPSSSTAAASDTSPSSLPISSAVAVSSQGGGYGVNYGGNFAEVVSSSTSSSSPPAASSSSSPPAMAPAPDTTPPPSAPAAGALHTVSTTYMTQGRQAYEIVVVDEQVTVTATSTLAAGKHKRHLHRHQHHHHQGGLA